MRTAFAAASLLALGVVADSRSMFAPVDVPTMTSGQMSATPIYGSSFAPLENMQYVQPSYVQPTAYVAEEESSAWMYAGAGALLLGALAAGRSSRGTSVAEPDLEAATGAARVATLAVSGRQFSRRDVAVGMGAALAAMAQSPAFAEEKKVEKSKESPQVSDSAPKQVYKPNGELATGSTMSTKRTPSDPNGCDEACRQKRLEKYGY